MQFLAEKQELNYAYLMINMSFSAGEHHGRFRALLAAEGPRNFFQRKSRVTH
jgi:hypothetical protein